MHTINTNNHVNADAYFGLLKVTGIDAKKMLQGQLTCQLDDLLENQIQLGAHCNPQGRVLSLFYLVLHQDAYYLLMHHSMVALALKALKKYAMFYKAMLSDASSETTIKNNIIIQLGFNQDNWKFDCIAACIPTLYPETNGLFLPQELNLIALNAVSFDKGCFTGQEIIARMHYRGKLKKHLHVASFLKSDDVKPGDEIYAANELCGNLIDFTPHIDHKLFSALILIDDHAQTKPLLLNNKLIITINTRECSHV